MVHYATFLASRVYLVHDTGGEISSFDAANDEATKVFNAFKINRFNVTNYTFKINRIDDAVDRYATLFVGAFLKYQKKISFFKNITGEKVVSYISESFLGKEPTRRTCLKSICEIMGRKTNYRVCSSLNNGHYALDDNGC